MELDQGSYRGAPDVLNGTLRYRHDLVMRIIALVQDEPDRFRTVSDLADEAGYSLEHFSRVFRSVMSRSPEDFLINGRIERAKRLLWDSSMSIQEIAQTLGYQRQSFFSTQFRKKTGQTPREFRTQSNARRPPDHPHPDQSASG
jgi:transcriptional regulator GlxA family with amidase domain